MSDAGYLYVYAVTRADAPVPAHAGAVGGAGATLRLLPCGELAVLVSAFPEPEILAARRHMLTHTKVLEALMAEATILPMRFGVIVDGEAHVRAAVLPRADKLMAMLDDLSDRIEVGIRASWTEAVLYREIVASRPDLGRMGAGLVKRDAAETYYDRIELGRCVEEAMALKRQDERRLLTDRLAPFSVRYVDLPNSDDMNVMNLALLVDKAREPALFAEIEAIERTEGERLQIKYVAPVPAYNFVAMKLDFMPPTALKGAA